MTRRRTTSTYESLWLTRSRKPLVVRLDRWADYPYFIETLEEFGDIPELVTVKWGPFADFTKYGFDDDGEWDFVDEVAARMKAGADIPPLIREGGRPLDGVHRAFAAKSLGLKAAPVVDLVRP